MTAHTAFIVGSYLVALVGLGGLAIASVVARRRARREIVARGLDRGR